MNSLKLTAFCLGNASFITVYEKVRYNPQKRPTPWKMAFKRPHPPNLIPKLGRATSTDPSPRHREACSTNVILVDFLLN